MTRRFADKIINEVCTTRGTVSRERLAEFEEVINELPYLEQACIKHLANGCTYETVGKILEVPVSYVKRQRKKAIRHMRTPSRYYRLLLGSEKYRYMLDNHTGKTRIADCGFTTRTKNTLEKNGFEYIEELSSYIGNAPERFTCIAGLGEYGMCEVMYFYKKEIERL